MVDSLYEEGDVSVWKKAIAHFDIASGYQDLQCGVDLMREALAQGEPTNLNDSVSYYFCVSNLASLLCTQNHFEEVLRMALDAMEPVKQISNFYYRSDLLSVLYETIVNAQTALLFMAQATRLFRTLATQQMMPAEICTRMNEALSGEDNESSMFVTFWLGLVDLKTGHLDFCNAGHNPPVIGGGEHHAEFLEMIPNTPIGLWPGIEYEGEAIDTIKGRPLFIYTDGLNEAENRQQDQFGDDRLLEILRTSHFDTAQQVIDILSAAVEQHRNGADPNDDLTMMCVRIN